MSPRYQVFVSSTFRDLREERQAALDAVLELGHFPAGMEIFPAADSTPWGLIRKIIAESDYYVLLVGGRYGSSGPEGISYTEMEFDLAVELEKPVLAFLHGAPDQIPVGKSELEPEARKRLEAFREKVSVRHCKYWANKDELKAAVLLGLVHAIRTQPAQGWVKNEGLENQELLRRLAGLQERHDRLSEEAVELRRLMGGEHGNREQSELGQPAALTFDLAGQPQTITLTWAELFFDLADDLLTPIQEALVSNRLRELIITHISHTPLRNTPAGQQSDAQFRASIRLTPDMVRHVTRHLMAFGLLEPHLLVRQIGQEGGRSHTFPDRCWVLSSLGREKYMSRFNGKNEA